MTRQGFGGCPLRMVCRSVLGPLIISGNAQRLGPTLCRHTCTACHLKLSIRSGLWVTLGQALTVLEMWMASNRLCLNPAKTKFIWLGTQQQLAKLDLTDISSQFPNYAFASSVRDLGVILDQELSFALT